MSSYETGLHELMALLEMERDGDVLTHLQQHRMKVLTGRLMSVFRQEWREDQGAWSKDNPPLEKEVRPDTGEIITHHPGREPYGWTPEARIKYQENCAILGIPPRPMRVGNRWVANVEFKQVSLEWGQ